MKTRITKTLALLAAFCGLQLFTATTAWAIENPRIVSFNVCQCWNSTSTGQLSGESYTTMVGTIPLAAWSQSTTQLSGDLHGCDTSITKCWNGTATIDIEGANNFKAATYMNGGTNLLGYPDHYLTPAFTDFRSGLNQAQNRNSADDTITFSNIPFEAYDVIIYFGGNGGTMHSVQVNDGKYYKPKSTTGGDNDISDSQSDWGDSDEMTLAYGTNVMRINGLSGATLKLKQNCTTYGIGAVQLVEADPPPYTKQMLYRFSLDTDGGKSADSTGAQTSTTEGTMTHVTSGMKFGTGCIKLSSNGSYVIDNIETTKKNGWTLSFWFSSDVGTWKDLLAFAIGSKMGKFERNGSSDLCIYRASADAADQIQPDNNPVASGFSNGWNHLAIVSTSTGFDVYLNGVKKSSVTQEFTEGLTKVFIGTKGYYQEGRTSNGLVDEVSIFNCALTKSQLVYLMNNQASVLATKACKANAAWGNAGNAYVGVCTKADNSTYTTDPSWTLNFKTSDNIAVKEIGGNGTVAIRKVRVAARAGTLDSTLVPAGLTISQGTTVSATAGAPTTSSSINVYKADHSVITTRTCYEFTFATPLVLDTATDFTFKVLKNASSGKVGLGMMQPPSAFWPMFEIVGDYYYDGDSSDITSVNFGTLTVGTAPGEVGGIYAPGWQDIIGNASQVAGTRNLVNSDGRVVGSITVSVPQAPYSPGGNTSSLTHAIQQSYFDLGANNKWTLNLAVDYLISDVILYFSGDGSKFSPVKVNSSNYIGGTDVTAGSATDWGTRNRSGVFNDANTIKVSKTVGGVYAIENVPQNSTSKRGTICGMQVVDRTADYAYFATVDSAASTAGLSWTRGTGATATLANIAEADRILCVEATGDNASLAFSGETVKVLVLKSGTLTISGTPTIDTLIVNEGATLRFADDVTFASGKKVVANGTISGGITFNSGSTLTFGTNGSLVIPSGKTVEWKNNYDKTMFRTLHQKTTGDGTLKIQMGSGSPEVHSASDSTALTANVNIDYIGSGAVVFVGSLRENIDVFTVAAGKTVTYAGGTIWPMRAEMVVNGTVIADYVKIGHSSSGDYPGKVTINSTGVVKTKKVAFSNPGATNNSVLTVAGVLEFTQNDESAITADVTGVKYSVNFNGGTFKADTSSWHVTSDIAVTIAGGTFYAAEGKTLAIAGVLSGSGNVSVTGAGSVVLNGANTDTGTYTVAEGASLTLGPGRTQTIDGTSKGTITITLTPDEKTTLDGGNSVELLAVSGGAFSGTLKTVDSTSAVYEINEPTISQGGKLVVTKKEGARMSPFNVTNPTNETWTIAGWTDSTTPTPLDVRPEDWDNKASANVTVSAETTKALTTDRALPIGTLTLNNAGTLTVSANGENTLTADELTIVNSGALTLSGNAITPADINDSASTGATTIGFAPGATPITAGENTILNTAGTGTYTINSGKKLTIKSGTIAASKVSNSGTLNFEGGSPESPIHLTGDGDFGITTLAANTYVKNTEDGSNRKYQVTGQGSSSRYALTRKDGGSPGMADNSTFNNLTLVAAVDSGKQVWLEHATLTDVGLFANPETEIYVNNFSPTIRSMGGSGKITPYGTAAVTISGTEEVDYSGQSTLAVTIATGSTGQTFSGNYTGALTVNDGAHVALGASAHPSSITVNGSGTVEFLPGCTYDFGTTTRALPTGYVLDEGVTVKATQTSEEFMAGKVEFTGLPDTITSITMTCADRVVVEVPVSGGKATYTDTSTKISGPATWLDYTFTKADLARRQSESSGSILNCGTAGVNISLAYDTGYTANNSYKTENGALLAKSTPYRRMNDTAAWPTNYTVAVYGNVPDVEKGCLIGFGSSTQGKKYLAIVRGATSNEILLMQGTDNATKADVIATMAAENATSSKHLIVFINDGTNFKIYCDGTKIQEVASSTLGEGLQIGSVHGGVAPGASYKGKDYTGITRISEIDEAAKKDAVEIGMIRVFNKVISDAEMDALVENFSYISHGGLYDRTISTAAENLKSDGAWKNHETEVPTDLPVTNQYESVWYRPSVDITTTVASTLTVNENAAFDKMTFGGAGTLTLVSDGTHSSEMSGALKVESPIVVTYGALDLTKSPTKITTDGSITFDLTGYPELARVLTWTKVRQLTGLMDSEGGVSIKSGTEPTGPNTISECYYDADQKQYWLAAKPARDAGTVYLVAGTSTLNDDTVVKTAGGADTLLLPGDTVVVTNSETLTLSQTIAIAGITVQSGTLKLTAGTTLPITVESGATFDLNGVETAAEANNFVVTLNGGTLTNSGTNKGILKSLTLLANSTVDVGVDKVVWIQSGAGGYSETTLALGTYTLTKTGAGEFGVVETTVSGTGTIDVQAGTLWTQENARFGTSTVKVGASGTFSVRDGKTATVANVNGDGGTLTVAGTITGFNLTGTIELTGTGTYGTITNAAQAVAKVGNRRDFTFAGVGTVDVKLTTQEEGTTTEITAFNLADAATTAVGNVYDSTGADVTSHVTKSATESNKFTINHEAKVGTTYYITLAKAISGAAEGSTITALADIATGDGIAVDKNITLDGAGCELTGAGFTGAGTLTIIGGRIGVSGLPTAYALQGGEYPAAKVTGEGAWTVASGYHLVDIYSTEALTYSKQVAIGSSPAAEDEKSYPVKPKGGSEITGAIVVKTSDLVEKGIVSEGATAAQVSEALGKEGANHYPTWQNVVLGLDNKVETSIPYPAPVQGTSNGQISLKLGDNVKVDLSTGAKVTYKVKTRTDSGWTTLPTEYGYGDAASVDLPESGVQYYQFDVIVTPAK